MTTTPSSSELTEFVPAPPSQRTSHSPIQKSSPATAPRLGRRVVRAFEFLLIQEPQSVAAAQGGWGDTELAAERVREVAVACKAESHASIESELSAPRRSRANRSRSCFRYWCKVKPVWVWKMRPRWKGDVPRLDAS